MSRVVTRTSNIARTLAALIATALTLAICSAPPVGATSIGTAKYIFADGYDTCQNLTDGQLSAFWNHTPLYFVGLYLGGSDGAAQGIGCDDIGASKWAYADSLGYGFVPFWYGRQMPTSCGGQSGRPYYISLDLSTAYGQGASQALNAVSAAQSHYLNDQDIIYLDVESYSDYQTPSCYNAEINFISGWDDELNIDTTYAPGLYGSTCGSALQTMWDNLSPRPNAIDASDYQDNHDGVFGLRCLADSAWSNDQRIHQFNSEDATFNGVTLGVDENCADARVDTSFGAKEPHDCNGDF